MKAIKFLRNYEQKGYGYGKSVTETHQSNLRNTLKKNQWTCNLFVLCGIVKINQL